MVDDFNFYNDKTIKANQKMLNKLSHLNGGLATPSVSRKVMTLYVKNAKAQAKASQKWLNYMKKSNSSDLISDLQALMQSQKQISLKPYNSHKYLANLRKSKLIDRKGIAKFVDTVNKKTLKKAKTYEVAMKKLIPKYIATLKPYYHKQHVNADNHNIKILKSNYYGWYKAICHHSFQKKVDKQKLQDKKYFDKQLKQAVTRAKNFLYVNTYSTSLLTSYDYNGDLNLLTTGDKSADKLHKVCQDCTDIDDYTYDLKTSVISCYNVITHKTYHFAKSDTTALFKLLVLEQMLVHLPYLKSMKSISTKYCFKSDLTVGNVFYRHYFYFTNQSKLLHHKGDSYLEDNGIAYPPVESDETKPTDIAQDSKEIVDYLRFIKK